MSQVGTMMGMEDLPTARNLMVKPFTLASRGAGAAVGPELAGNEFDGGIDLRYWITPSLTLDGTWRTDFSQVEVDQEQVNLTRFPVFFPGKREFFLENSGTFASGIGTADREAPGWGPASGTSPSSSRGRPGSGAETRCPWWAGRGSRGGWGERKRAS